MSTVEELKDATERVPPEQQWELYRWLGEAAGIRQFRLRELRREIALGIVEADRGECAPLDVQALKDEFRRRSKSLKGS